MDGVTTKARVESHVTREYHAMDVSDDSRVVKLVKEAAARMGLEVKTLASGGGCDANIFNKRGIECANLGTGMRAIHTVKEWLDVKGHVRLRRDDLGDHAPQRRGRAEVRVKSARKSAASAAG